MKAWGYAFTVMLLAMLSGIGSIMSAQTATAEKISEVFPPKGNVKYKDGVRHITLHNNLMLVTNYWAGLQVLDISDIQNPTEIAFFPADDESFATTVAGEFAYLANHAKGVTVFDLSDLSQIRKVAGIKLPGNAYQVEATGQNLYVAMGDSGIAMVNIADMTNPKITHFRTTGKWIQEVKRGGNYLYAAAKNNGLLIFQISGDQLQQIGQLATGFNTNGLQVEDDLVYLADGPGGLAVVNVANPASPQLVARFDKGGFVGQLHKVGNYVYLANRNKGLRIVNITDPQRPFLEGAYQPGDICYGVVKRDVYVFLAANSRAEILRHNNSPRLARLPEFKLKENEPFEYRLDVTEPDGDAFSYRAFNLPEGAEFDTTSGVLRWTPNYEQSGKYSGIKFVITEKTASALTAVDSTTLIVQHVNRAPDLPSLRDTTIAENQQLQFVLPEGSDPDKEDAGKLTYRAENLPQGAQFDPVTRQFSWTPTFEQSGIYTIDFLVDDGAGGVDREPITITVTHVDRPPVLAAIADQTVAENELLTLTISGEEPDAEDLGAISFRVENLPEGAQFDPASREFRWTPTFDQSGTYPDITVIMTAGKLSDTTKFAITVTHVNRAPEIALIPPQEVRENQTLTFTVNASDPDVEDAGKLSISATNLPAGAVFDPQTNTFSWTPSFEQSGTYGIQFIATDPAGLSDEKTAGITVIHVNRAPTIADVAPITIDENQPLQITLQAQDPDKEDAGKLRFSAIDLPEGATLDPQSGVLEWTPTFDQSGIYAPTAIVTDGEYADSTTIKIEVRHVNRPPVLATVSPQQIEENQLLTFSLTATDPDVEDGGKLQIRAQNLPQGATFDDASATFSWTPNYEQSGTYAVTFTASDPAGLTAETEVPITVLHVNRPPALAAIQDVTVLENQPVNLQFTATDPDKEDADKLRFSANTLPDGAVLDPATGVFEWTPNYDQSGIYPITVTVTDGAGATAEQQFTITVEHVNRPPQLVEVATIDGKENQLLSYTFSGSDPDVEDQQQLVYEIVGLPEGASFDTKTGKLQWQPTYDQSGTYPIEVSVRDSQGAVASIRTNITIQHVNRPPVLPVLTEYSGKENEPLTVTLPAATDPDKEDADKLTYTVGNLPEGAIFDAATRTLTWTPSYQQAGVYEPTYTVSDGTDEASSNFRIQIENVNRPPVLAKVAELQIQEGQLLEFRLDGSDPDQEDNGKLVYTATNLPPGANLDSESGRFTWTPDTTQQGTYLIEFVVSDPAGARAIQTVTIVVTNAIITENQKP
jgi:hypothetical protein